MNSQTSSPPEQVSPPVEKQSFTYGYMTFRCEATLNARSLTVKQGLRTFRAEIPKLKHLFVHSSRATPQQTLYLSEERSSGKNKIHRFYANPGDPGFQALVEAILALRPDIDLRGQDEKTALKKIGVANHDLIGLMIMVLVVPTIIGIALLPKAVHGLDFGEDRISIASLAKGKTPDSRNVVISGARALMGDSIEVTTTTTKGGVETGSSQKFFVPIVPATWDKSQPVHVILETDEMNSSEEAKLEHASKFRGVVRDVLWEGLASGERDYFVNDVGLELSNDVKLVEYRANPRFDLMVFLGATGLTFVVMSTIALGMWFKRRRG